MGHAEDFITILEMFGSRWLDLCKRDRVIRFEFLKLVPTGYKWKYSPIMLQGEVEGAIDVIGRLLQLGRLQTVQKKKVMVILN